MMDELRGERVGEVLTIWIDRPSRRNAMTDAMWRMLPSLLSSIEQDDSIRVVVIRGAGGRSFCAGADLGEYRLGISNPSFADANRKHVSAGIEAVRLCSRPVVAAISGACVGGGVGLATACDVRVASSDSFFRVPPAELGLVYPFEETRDLAALIGARAARRLLITASSVAADEALRIGLVDEVADDRQFETRLDSIIQRICSNSPLSVAAMKRICLSIERNEPDAAERADQLALEALMSNEHAERITRLFPT